MHDGSPAHPRSYDEFHEPLKVLDGGISSNYVLTACVEGTF